MSINPNEVWEPTSDHRTPAGTLHSEAARDHLWMHFTRHSVFEDRSEGGLGHTVPIITKGQGWKIWDDRGNEYIDGLAGLFVVQVGHGREELAEAAAKQAKELAFFPLWSYAHPKAIELAERLASPCARRPQPRLLHDRRRRGGRDRVEAGQAVLQADRQADEAQGHLARRRLPRHAPGRPVDHRHPGRQGDVRAARARRAQGAEHQHVPRSRAPPGRREGLRPLGRRPHRRGHRVRGARHRRGRLPRAGAELRWLLPAARRLLRARPRDLRRVRRAARVRRGHLQLRPHRLDVRLRRLRLRARHHHLRQGHDERLLPHRRDDRERPALRAVQVRHDVLPARLHLRRPPGLGGGRHGQPRHLRARGPQRPRQGRTPRSSRRRSTSCSTCRSSATSAAPATSTASSSSRTRRPARPSTTPSPSACCAASSPRRSSTPASTAAPTTAATPSSSSRRRSSWARSSSTTSSPGCVRC